MVPRSLATAGELVGLEIFLVSFLGFPQRILCKKPGNTMRSILRSLTSSLTACSVHAWPIVAALQSLIELQRDISTFLRCSD